MLDSGIMVNPFIQTGDSLTNDEKEYLLEFYKMYDDWTSQDNDFNEGFNKHHQLLEFYYDDLTHNKILNGFAYRKVGILETDVDTCAVIGEYNINRMLAMITQDDDHAEAYHNSGLYEYRNIVEEKEKKLKKRQKEVREHGDCIVFCDGQDETQRVSELI